MSKYKITQQKGLGCCSLVLWDTLLLAAAAVLALTPEYSPFELTLELHIVFRVLIGIAAAIVLFLLMKIRFVGAVIQVALGALWGYIVCGLLERLTGVFTRFSNDPVMYWTITILIYGLFVLLHFVSVRNGIFDSDKIIVESMDDAPPLPRGFDDEESDDEDEDAPDYEPVAKIPSCENPAAEIEGEIERYKKLLTSFDELFVRIRGELGGDGGELSPQIGAAELLRDNSTDRMNTYIEIFNDAESNKERKRIITRMREYVNELGDEQNELRDAFSSLLSARLHNLPPRQDNPPQTAGSVVSYFHGCDTREKLDKRYKNLAKSFHPDLEAGDNESMQLVNEEYERLKRKLDGGR